MKIEETTGSHIYQLTIEKGASKGTTGNEFDSILRDTGEKKFKQTDFRREDISAEKTLQNMEYKDTSPLIKHVERLLNTLDEYRNKLGDTTVPLDDIAPLVDRLEKERSDLVPSIQHLSERDSLKDILSNTVEFSSREIVRFKRGDYRTQ